MDTFQVAVWVSTEQIPVNCNNFYWFFSIKKFAFNLSNYSLSSPTSYPYKTISSSNSKTYSPCPCFQVSNFSPCKFIIFLMFLQWQILESWATPNWSKGLVGQEESRSQIPSPRSSIPSPRSRIPNPQFQFSGPRSQIPNPKTCKVWLRL